MPPERLDQRQSRVLPPGGRAFGRSNFPPYPPSYGPGVSGSADQLALCPASRCPPEGRPQRSHRWRHLAVGSVAAARMATRRRVFTWASTPSGARRRCRGSLPLTQGCCVAGCSCVLRCPSGAWASRPPRVQHHRWRCLTLQQWSSPPSRRSKWPPSATGGSSAPSRRRHPCAGPQGPHGGSARCGVLGGRQVARIEQSHAARIQTLRELLVRAMDCAKEER